MTLKIPIKAIKSKCRIKPKRIGYTVLTLLALIVGITTIWFMMEPASAMSNELICQQEEHIHSDECFAQALVCTEEENEAHTHTELCWTTETICKIPEHTHSEACYEPAPAQSEPETPTEVSEQAVSETTAETEPSLETEPAETEATAATETVPAPSEDGTQTEQNNEQSLPSVPALDKLPRVIPAEYTDIRTADLQGSSVKIYSIPGVLPEDAEVHAEFLGEDSEAYDSSIERLHNAGIAYDYVTALDISLYNEAGEKVEPSAPVYVELEMDHLIPSEADGSSVQIQHHKELAQLQATDDTTAKVPDQPEVLLEIVLDMDKGLVRQSPEGDLNTVVFAVDSFSAFTITSKGWPELKINVSCVDEWEDNILMEVQGYEFGYDHTSNSSFGISFSSGNGTFPQIQGYDFNKKAYFMRNGVYEERIYGLYYQNKQWYFITKANNGKPDWNAKQLITPQPDFVGENPKDSIRLMYKKMNEIPVEYVNLFDQPLDAADAPGGSNPGIVKIPGKTVSVSNVDLWPKSQTYYYIGKAYVGEHKGENEISYVITKGDKVYGITPEKVEIELSSATPLRLIYGAVSQNPVPPRSPRSSTRDKGMIINLFNYNSGDNFDKNAPINKDKNLQFVLRNDRPEPYNKWTGFDGGIYTGIVEKTLGTDGYPVVKGQSLAYLFDPAMAKADLDANGGNGMIREVHTGLDRLFWLDKDGYYRYDSMRNFATVDDEQAFLNGERPAVYTNGRDFIVYDQPALPSTPAVGDNPKFLPFNTWTEANRPTAEPASSEKIKQYHFGMTIEAEFVIPTGGVVPDAEGNHTAMRDMIFEFNGDDDVWVFIDDKLVLDLGGIHDRYGGSINFRTGEVITNAPPMEHSGHSQPNLYGIEGDPNELSEDELAQKREEAGFGRFSQHKFKFFYLERGRGASNCEIHFNLVPVAHGFAVGKRVSNSDHVASTHHKHYQFQVDVQHPGEEKHPLRDAQFLKIRWEHDGDPVNGGKPDGVGITDQDGRFWLEPGQRADFTNAINLKKSGMTEDKKTKIIVSEILPDGRKEPKVTAWSGKEEEKGTYLVIRDDQGKERRLIPPMYDSKGYEFHTEKTNTPLTRSQIGNSVIQQAVLTSKPTNEFNWIDFENDIGRMSKLNITKEALRTPENIPITGIDYSVKVELWDDMQQQWVLLEDGSPYWLLNHGEPIPDQNSEPTHFVAENADGQIPIRHGQTIHMLLIPGTKYRVSEILSAEELQLYTTTYTGEVQDDDDIITPFNDENDPLRQTGIGNENGIKEGATHNIRIKNYTDAVIAPKGAFSLTKQVVGEVPTSPDTKFHFQIGIKRNQSSMVPLSDEIQSVAFYHDTPQGIVHATETVTFTPDADGQTAYASVFLYPGETVVLTGLPEGYTVSVQENLTQEQEGNYEVSLQEDKQEVIPGNRLESTVAEISSSHVVRVTCTNKSSLKPTTALLVTKEVRRVDTPDGAPTDADRQRDFTFSITLKDSKNFSAGAHKATIEADGTVQDILLQFEPAGADFKATFTLRHGQTLRVPDLPTDVNVVVQEHDHGGYAVSMNDQPGDVITVFLKVNTGAPYEVHCVNLAGMVIPETGGIGRMPYIILGAILLCGGAAVLYRRKKFF